MDDFKSIFKIAKKVKIENAEIDEERKKLKKIEEAKKKIKIVSEYKSNDYRKNNCSEELLGIIDKYNFNIKSYVRGNCDDYDELLETYYCEFNNWIFQVKNYSDVDIEEGVFAVSDLRNIVTGENVAFYCDLGCRNTSELRLEKFIKCLSFKSEAEFAESYYKDYIKLPELLVNNGLNCDIVEKNYTLQSIDAILKIYDGVYLGFRSDYTDKIKIVLSNSQIYLKGRTVGKYLKYYFDYHGDEDIEELVKCIKAFKEHVDGRFGYFECGEYFQNKNIEKYMNNFISSVKCNDDGYNKWNHYLIKVFDKSGSNVNINKYNGLEIFKKYELTFNDFSQWSVGNKTNKSIITIKYDTKKDREYCELNIKNYVYTFEDQSSDLYIHNDNEYDEEDVWMFSEVLLNEKYMVANVVKKGSFIYVLGVLKEYIESMCEIHEIPF